MPKATNKISDEAVKKATGKNPEQWFALLDKAGMKDRPHKEMAEYLLHKQKVKPWWCQMVTVAYEKHHGKRITGQTAAQGFEIGVQKTLNRSSSDIWELVTSPAGIKYWLEDELKLKFVPGEKYRTKSGTTGEIRTVHKGERLRLTYQPKGWAQPSTLQLYFLPTGNKTSLRFHHEKLKDVKQREAMRKHWQQVLDKLRKQIN